MAKSTTKKDMRALAEYVLAVQGHVPPINVVADLIKLARYVVTLLDEDTQDGNTHAQTRSNQ